jgi:hypothetical protein
VEENRLKRCLKGGGVETDTPGGGGFIPPTDGGGFRDFYTTGRILFTTVEKKILENYRCIVPNFMND